MRRSFCLCCTVLCIALCLSFLPARADTPADAETEVVASMQRLLIYYGYLPEGADDGVFGDVMKKAVLLFQSKNGLWETGTIDTETYNALTTGMIEDEDADPPQRDVIRLEPAADRAVLPDEETVVSRGEMVWIPNSGRRYHNSSTCSGMNEPSYVTIEEAIGRGFTPCQKCY